MYIALAVQTTKAKIDVHIYDDKCFEGWPVLRRIKIKQALQRQISLELKQKADVSTSAF
jgi:hypothetical protein